MGEEEKQQQREEVVIVGGGIAGLATAVALQRFGVRSLVLERSHELRSTGAALSLFPNAWRALDALGVAHKLTSLYPEFLTGAGGGGTGVRAVHRKMLLEALAEELSPATIRFSSKLASINISDDPKDSTVTLDVVRHADLSSLTWAPLMLRAPWNVVAGPMQRGSVTVAGDAMHPMTPDLGQGGCAALEDAVVLARCIGPALLRSSAGGGAKELVEEGMKKYVGERKWRVAGLVVGSYISGWVQQGGSGLWGWFVEWFRDHVFYRFLFTRIASAVNYDCGDLPKKLE